MDRPEPFKTARLFRAPRQRLFEAWTSTDAVRRWFSPASYSVPDARVEPRAGGAFDVCMRAPDGTSHWMRGTILEIEAVKRIVMEGHVAGPDGAPLFTARTQALFTDADGGARLEIEQGYDCHDPEVERDMVKRAPEGWGTTLDKLQALVEGEAL